jgi:ABC-2 type transport system ATP-binding protein
MIGTPDEMKAALLERSIILDAADRPGLVRELSGLGLAPVVGEDGLVRVAYEGVTAQSVIARIATPLTVLRVHDPSLEEAYVELLRSAGPDATEEAAA